MLLNKKYYDYFNDKTKERTLSVDGVRNILEIFESYHNMLECGINSYDDKVNFVKNYFEKGDI